MTEISQALIPICLIIAIGYSFRKSGFIPDETWPGLEKINYYFFLPMLLLGVISKQSIEDIDWQIPLTVTVLSILSTSLILLIWHKKRKTVSGARFTSYFQGGVRFNTYLTLALSESFYGSQGLVAGSIVCGFIVIQVNLWCLGVFGIWGKNSGLGITAYFRSIFCNPLILGCLGGWLISLSGVQPPSVLSDFFDIIGRAVLPFGLLAVGAALRLRSVKDHLLGITMTSCLQFLWKPSVTFIILLLLPPISVLQAGVLMIAFTSPTAPSSYILAKQLGGDADIMASMITFQTFLAFIAFPLVYSIFSANYL